jgi:hypothetical protein
MSGGVRSRLQQAAGSGPNSLASKLRQRRFEHIRGLFDTIPRPFKMLDVGGTQRYWETVGMSGDPEIDVTLLNLTVAEVDAPGMHAVAGNAVSMPEYSDKEFDVVFSNSVIEHVGGLDNQRKMANEVKRLGRRYYVQTPNRYFPMEPHFLFPFFGIMPISMRAWLLRHRALGWYARIDDPAEALQIAKSIRLLTRRELMTLFPDGKLVKEKFAGFTKSYSVYGGEW